MLIDANNNEQDLVAPICIIGSGVGGGSLVKKFTEQNLDFIVIEAGGLKGNADSVSAVHSGREFGVRTTRSIQIGGTSNLWHGVLSPLDKIDFEKRHWIPHSGWPIGYADLEPYYKQAAEILGIRDFDLFNPEKLDAEVKQKLQDIAFDREWLQNKIFQQPLPCKNFKETILQCVENSATRHCYYNAVALELLAESNGRSVKQLIVGNQAGKKFKVLADTFIIASGALETPRLLLNSKQVHHKGMGNEGDQVGRFLMDHPMGNLCQLQFNKPQKAPLYSDFKYQKDLKIKTGLELTERQQQAIASPNHNFYLRPSFIKGIDDTSEQVKLSLLAIKDGGVTIQDMWRVMCNLNVIRQILAYKLSLNVTYKYADLFFVTEQIPNPDSRVMLAEQKDSYGYPIAEINWQVLPEDIESVRRWFDFLRKAVFAKQDFVFTHGDADFNWEDIFTSAIHHVGTARMSASVKEGVVDRNLQVFGLENLYVCDGSIFTTAGNVNNSFTISAFACRLSAFLAKQ